MAGLIIKRTLLASLLTALASVPTALAADWGGLLSYSYNFKPEFYESDGPGNYHLLGGSARLKDGATTYRLGLSVFGTNTPEREVAVLDPSLSVSHTVALAEGGPSVTGTLGVSPGLSIASRDADKRGAVSGSVALAHTLGKLSLGLSAGAVRHIYQYTRGTSGAPTPVLSTNVGISIGYAITESLAVGVSLGYGRVKRHAGDDVYGYDNGIELSYAVDDRLSVSAGLSTTDAQLQAGREENNEFSLYKRNQTEGSVGMSYAL
jgi:hypothetical protein